MTQTQHRSEQRGKTRRRFVQRIREIAIEYLERGLGANGAMHEVLAAIREMDRRANRDVEETR